MVEGNHGVVLANVDVVVPPATRVRVPLKEGIVPAGIRVVGIVKGIQSRVGCADSESGTAGSKAQGH